jgi:hypothetical protein
VFYPARHTSPADKRRFSADEKSPLGFSLRAFAPSLQKSFAPWFNKNK